MQTGSPVGATWGCDGHAGLAVGHERAFVQPAALPADSAAAGVLHGALAAVWFAFWLHDSCRGWLRDQVASCAAQPSQARLHPTRLRSALVVSHLPLWSEARAADWNP